MDDAPCPRSKVRAVPPFAVAWASTVMLNNVNVVKAANGPVLAIAVALPLPMAKMAPHDKVTLTLRVHAVGVRLIVVAVDPLELTRIVTPTKLKLLCSAPINANPTEGPVVVRAVRTELFTVIVVPRTVPNVDAMKAPPLVAMTVKLLVSIVATRPLVAARSKGCALAAVVLKLVADTATVVVVSDAKTLSNDAFAEEAVATIEV
jgi:hypothetical protein